MHNKCFTDYWHLDISGICMRFFLDLKDIYLKLAWDIPKICTRFTLDLQQISLAWDCMKFALDIPKICTRFTLDFHKIPLAWDLPEICLTYNVPIRKKSNVNEWMSEWVSEKLSSHQKRMMPQQCVQYDQPQC